MTAYLRSFVVVAVMATMIAACGKGSPIVPTPTCQDPEATNFGGPLPCVYPPPPPPPASFARVNYTIPASGSILNRAKKENVYTMLDYGVSQADLDEAARTGDAVYTVACLSVDGIATIPICFYRPAPGTTGTTNHLLAPSNSSGIGQTNYIITYLIWFHADGALSTEKVIPGTTNVSPGVFIWTW